MMKILPTYEHNFNPQSLLVSHLNKRREKVPQVASEDNGGERALVPSQLQQGLQAVHQLLVLLQDGVLRQHLHNPRLMLLSTAILRNPNLFSKNW